MTTMYDEDNDIEVPHFEKKPIFNMSSTESFILGFILGIILTVVLNILIF